jgi:inorganic triphosphatase YgiF
MNAQDFRSLQEAYMEVYSSELDEAKIDDNLSGQKKKDIRNERSKFGGSSSSKSKKTKLRHDLHKKYRGLKKVPGDKSVEKEIAVLRNSQRMHGTLPKIQKIGGPKGLPEQTDLYDIILSHLLDEGYADTEQAAEAIMVNMSEDWRESICEAEIEPPKERVGALTNIDIPMSEREVARQRTLAKAKAKREKNKN